jgi:hypothetical protein
MRVKVLSLAVILASIIALPVPASQLLAGTFSAPSPVARTLTGDSDFVFLLADPFLMEVGTLSPMSHVELDAALKSAQL